jgi:hypothetical protein
LSDDEIALVVQPLVEEGLTVRLIISRASDTIRSARLSLRQTDATEIAEPAA